MSQRRHGEPLPLGDDDFPYSKGLMARALIAAGVPADRAYQLARRLELDLAERGESSVDVERLEGMAQEILGEEEGERATNRLRRLADLQSLDIPIIVLIGGSTGTGKSTVAAEVAHRLGITRVASTDFIRQTMRAFFSKEFMPSIHFSSFEAAGAVADSETGDPTLLGFLEPVRHFLDDPQVSEIMINGPDQIYIERHGKLELTTARFPSMEALTAALRNMAQYVGKHIDADRPILEA